jgi:hypothetical protein
MTSQHESCGVPHRPQTPAPLNLVEEAAHLSRLTISGLRSRYEELYGDPTRSGNRDHLVRRILWRLQADREGGLSERARQRARELARDSDVRVREPRRLPASAPPTSMTVTGYLPRPDRRIPAPGTILRKDYKGNIISVRVLPSGFEFEGVVYASLSAIANAVTGGHWNGARFFGLDRPTPRGGRKESDR